MTWYGRLSLPICRSSRILLNRLRQLSQMQFGANSSTLATSLRRKDGSEEGRVELEEGSEDFTMFFRYREKYKARVWCLELSDWQLLRNSRRRCSLISVERHCYFVGWEKGGQAIDREVFFKEKFWFIPVIRATLDKGSRISWGSDDDEAICEGLEWTDLSDSE